MRAPTQQDVACRVSVSRATVSYIINNRTDGKVRISEETRQRVLQAVKELGYQPNMTARSLCTRRMQLLAIMVPDLTNSFYPQLIRKAQAGANSR